MKRVVSTLVLLLLGATVAGAQQQTGEIFGKVVDQSGGVLPGVTVTITAPNLLQPLTAVTSETGTYQFPRLEIGTYNVKFELTGFKTIVNEGIRVTVGFSAQVNAQMLISSVTEELTVTGQSPVVDTKETGTKQTFTNELLQSIPSARDPWVILQQTAGIAMDRENIGGNQSGQQSQYVSRGSAPFNNKWALDGVDITDMSATGGSPSYYDFDAFEEMTITTGGVDVTQQTGGVGINLVTKSGSDKFRGSGRYYVTDENVESQNITDAQRLQGASSGNPIQNIKDYGTEMGGPIKKGRAWVWGSYGKQLVDVGVINFYQPTPACQQIKADEAANVLSHSITDVNNCLNTDQTLLETTNLKTEVQLFNGNKLTLFSNFAKKDRNARGADDLHPIETTTPQGAVPTVYGIGKNYWTIGPNPTYKAGDQYVISDRTLLDVQWAHIGNNFVLDFHDPSFATVQPTYVINSPSGLNGRSGTQAIYIRPVSSVNVNVNYFMPAGPGGDHSFKIGGYWRDANSYSNNRTGGNATARFPTSAELASATDCATLGAGCQADLTRDGQSIYDLANESVYGQDTIVHGRVTLQLGVRYDRLHDLTQAASVPSSPLTPTILPGVNFGGADPGIIFNNFSPRVGFTYDLKGDGKTLVRGNYARYYGQVGTGGVSSQINPVTSVTVRYGWVDANHDGVIQSNELYDSKGVSLLHGGNPAAFLNQTGNWDPANPGSPTTKNTIDPNLKNDSTDELIFGFDHEVGANFAVGANYIWRRYENCFANACPGWAVRNGVATDGSSYTAVVWTPPASSCPAGAACPAVTYYQPLAQLSTISNETNIDGYNRTFNGLEVTGRKRLSNHWLMNTSFAYNSTIANFGPNSMAFASQTTGNPTPGDPTNVSMRNGYQWDYATSGSGVGNVYVNSKWLYKLSGMYQLPADVNVSAFFNARQGYPYERTVTSPSRANGAGTVAVLLDPIGSVRLPNYENLDFHIERPVKAGTVRLIPALDVFNVFNANTIQAERGTQNSANANYIQAILAPRVLRAGVRVTW